MKVYSGLAVYCTLMVILISVSVKAQKLGIGSTNLHSIVVNSSGTVYTWGNNQYGQLGNGNNTESNIPVAVRGLLTGKTITQIAAGSFHSIAVASDGTVYTWGYNYYGQLGNGSNTDSNAPATVSGLLSGKDIIQTAAGNYHSIALASDGTVYTWGYNSDGELGNSDNTESNVPVAVSSLSSAKTITHVAAGGFHSIALASDGTSYTWGSNYYGQLGTGNNTNSNVPVEVGNLLSGKTITQVAAGGSHSIVLTSNGTVYTWGSNHYGQLGNGNNTDSNVPVLVGNLLSGKTIIEVAAGYYHSIALMSDGTVYTWGYNYYGQLGNGKNIDSNIPVAVGGLLSGKTIVQVAAGEYHSIALASDGTIYTWGLNYNGELGDGTGTNSNIPVAVNQTDIGALPVELTSFTASVSGNLINLNWQTETEVNSYGFSIERYALITLRSAPDLSQNAESKVWKMVGFVKGHGSSNSPNKYSFTDTNPLGGSEFEYRLKEIDNSGAFKYSKVVDVKIAPGKYELFQNYPNPFNPSTVITYQLPVSGKVLLKVYDILGNVVSTLVDKIQPAGNHQVVFNTQQTTTSKHLSSGVYFYRINSGNFREVKKMIVLK